MFSFLSKQEANPQIWRLKLRGLPNEYFTKMCMCFSVYLSNMFSRRESNILTKRFSNFKSTTKQDAQGPGNQIKIG